MAPTTHQDACRESPAAADGRLIGQDLQGSRVKAGASLQSHSQVYFCTSLTLRTQAHSVTLYPKLCGLQGYRFPFNHFAGPRWVETLNCGESMWQML